MTLFCLHFTLAATLQGDSCHNSRPPSARSGTVANTSGGNKNARTDKRLTRETKILPVGGWGGREVRLNVVEGGATIEYDCAHGTIDQSFEVGEGGEFELPGTHEDEIGGPAGAVTAVDESGSARPGPARHPARYTGSVSDREMTLTVTLTDTGRVVGTFKLVRGAVPRLHKCLS
jgi:hypothetical protein